MYRNSTIQVYANLNQSTPTCSKLIFSQLLYRQNIIRSLYSSAATNLLRSKTRNTYGVILVATLNQSPTAKFVYC